VRHHTVDSDVFERNGVCRFVAEVEPVVAHLEETLGVPVAALRLLTVDGSDGARGGRVTYHVEALRPPPGNLNALPGFSGCRPRTVRSGSRPSLRSPPPSQLRPPHSPTSIRTWCRPSWRARRVASTGRRPPSRTGVRRSWLPPCVTCSTARSARSSVPRSFVPPATCRSGHPRLRRRASGQPGAGRAAGGRPPAPEAAPDRG
jgi:hypothetical protein